MTKKSILRLLQASLMCCLAVLFTACDDIFASEDNPTPAYLSMNTAPVTIKAGDTFKRKAISVTSAIVEYTSSDTNVATVDGEGVVTAIAEGTATITATATGYSTGGKKIFQADSKSYKLTVKPATLPAATINTAPTATASIAAGLATALVTAGVADGGTMMYEVTATNTKPTSLEGFSATIPTAATLAAGTYYVWYYVKADADHSDSEIAATAIAVTVTEAAWAANVYNEGSWNSTLEKVEFTKMTAASVTAVTNSDAAVTWGDGWYTVSGNVTITGNVTLTADTYLILQDGATLTINGQLDCRTNSKNLYIYGQKKGDGKLNVTNNSATAITSNSNLYIYIHGGEVTASAAGNYSYGLYTGYLAVYGGKLTATSGGGNGLQFSSSFDVYGGEVVATSNATSSARYGILSQAGAASQILTVYGGKMTATGNGIDSGFAYGSGIKCYVKSGTSDIAFYFSDNGTTWGPGYGYTSAASVVGTDGDTKKRYAKAE